MISQGRYQEVNQMLEPFKQVFLGSFLLGKAQFYLGLYTSASSNLDRSFELIETHDNGLDY